MPPGLAMAGGCGLLLDISAGTASAPACCGSIAWPNIGVGLPFNLLERVILAIAGCGAEVPSGNGAGIATGADACSAGGFETVQKVGGGS
jgi:hypothetical protein